MNKEIEILEKKYIDLILNLCLNFKSSSSLLVLCDLKEHLGFAKKVKLKAKSMGVKDIKIIIQDLNEIHDYLLNTELENIELVPVIDRSILDEYAKKKASILFLTSTIPGLMNDISAEKIHKMTKIREKTMVYYRQNVSKYIFPWCIVSLPNEKWANDLFPDEDSYEKLYRLIFKMCMVDEKDPIKSWNSYIEGNNYYKEKLNNMRIKSLHYKNSLGTDLTIGIPNNNIWLNMDDQDAYGNRIMPNLPSYEIFTSPDWTKTNGIVFSSKPLYYNGCCIDKFWIKFEEGKAIECNAEIGNDVLHKLIFENENADKLGEVALVPFDSPISNTGVTFKTTLFDENASCHLALGSGFETTFMNYEDKSIEQLKKEGLNISTTHVDFMIGTNDLEIEAETEKGIINIFKDGNFNI